MDLSNQLIPKPEQHSKLSFNEWINSSSVVFRTSAFTPITKCQLANDQSHANEGQKLITSGPTCKMTTEKRNGDLILNAVKMHLLPCSAAEPKTEETSSKMLKKFADFPAEIECRAGRMCLCFQNFSISCRKTFTIEI